MPPDTPATKPTKEFVIHSPLNAMTSDGKPGPDKQTTDDARWQHMTGMMEKMILAMQMQIDALQKKFSEKPDYKRDEKNIPYINSKDVDKPAKYDGTQFKLWYQNFTAFLGSKDERFETLLNAIKDRSQAPLTEDDKEAILEDSELTDENLSKAFKSQLFRYLQSCTKGEAYTVVLAGGTEGVFESMRQLCDSGNSQQQYRQREERR